MKPTRIGILGCGKVSHMYVPTLVRTPAVEIGGVADLDPNLARKVADQYGVGPVVSVDELIVDPSIELIVNLTPIAAHVDTTRTALAAGKHVYVEKPLATSVDDARALLAEADRRGRALACAPDTLLGSGFQAAWQAMTDARIGRPLTVSASMLRGVPNAPSFYTAGATPFFDMAPYYVSALICLFGPARRVSGMARTWPSGERPADPPMGAPIAVSGVLEFAHGATADLTLSWGIEHRGEVTALDVFGTSGTLAFPNPNNFGDPAYVRPFGEREWTELPDSRQAADVPPNLRGLGVAEMAQALRDGRTPRASAELACHVVDVIAGLVRAAEYGERVELTTTCTPPDPWSGDARDQLVR